MGSPSPARKQLMDEIVQRNKELGDKKFHSESSLQNFGEAEATPEIIISATDPGVQNVPVSSANGSAGVTDAPIRRTVSTPGPVSGSLLTATAARAARKKNVNYNDLPKMTLSNGGDGSGTATPTGDRGSPFQVPPLLNGTFQRNDLKSPGSYRSYSSAPGTPRKRSTGAMDAQSITSIQTHAPPPTSTEDNKKLTKKYLALVISSMYAILLVTLGLIIFIGDAVIDLPVASSYSIFLSAVGFLYHIFLMFDIARYKKTALQNQKIKSLHEDKIAEFYRKQEEDFGINSPEERSSDFKVSRFPAPDLLPLSHHYCFSQGRHSGSFYLKMGAAGFAVGNLVHSILLIVVQMAYLLDEDIENDKCVEYSRVAMDFFYPFYCFLQLFFVFKYSNVIILRGQSFARFAFMHMIGSSLCFWISAIVRETVLALSIYAQYLYGSDDYEYTSTSSGTISGGNMTSRFFDVSGLYNEECIIGTEAISAIYQNFSPYLYPFSVEFNILIVAVYYIIWSNVGNCHNEDSSSGNSSESNNSLEDNYSVCKIPTASEENDFTSNMVIYADCHASNKGLFAGLIVTVVIVGMLIVGFVFSSVGGEFLGVGYMVNDITKLSLHSIMLFTSILAFTQTTRLDINEHPISLLDDILLFICLPPFFMETVFSLIATLTILNVVKSVDFIVMVIQVLIQTPLIMDGLRRCSNTRKLRRQKPARELIMFLLITNVAMWLFYTFSYKSPESLDERYEYYGKVVWTILGHVSLPLIMFYRFHSSVCFADIWDSAYKPGSEH